MTIPGNCLRDNQFMAPKKKLTVKQQRFIDLYEGNATDAARKAGYKGNDVTLGQVGKENLQKPQIAEALRNRENERNTPLIADREERQAFWSGVFRGDNKQKIVVGKGEDQEVVEIPPKMADRLKASELLGRSEADFIDRTELTGADGAPLVVFDDDKD